MEYREYKNTGINLSLLGMGCMRLPKIDPDAGAIDETIAQEMVDYAYEHGVNYFDTAYTYHDFTSEIFLGKALEKYPRDSYYFATKLPMWKIESKEMVEDIFEEQLKKCNKEYFDFYLLHAMNEQRYEMIEKYDIYEAMLKKKAEGKIRYLGFSFHDSPEVLQKMCDKYEWDFAQLQVNYLDWDMQRAKEQYEILENHNIPCVVMEPIRGGSLASLSPQAEEILKEAEPNNSIASWALRWVASKPNVMVVLSGMSDMPQMADNVSMMEPFAPIGEQEQAVLDKALEVYREKNLIPCTGCGYCMDCGFGLNIPKIFACYNNYKINEPNNISFIQEMENLSDAAAPTNCRSCGKCVKLCPQHIDIPAEMKRIAEEFEL